MNERSARILECAIALLDDHGFDGVTARLIAKELGIPSSSVFYYYPTHRELWDAVQDYIMEVAETIVSKSISDRANTPAKDKFESYILGTLAWARQYPAHVKVLIGAFLRAGSMTELRQAHHKTTARGIEKIYGMLAMAKAEGDLVTKVDLKRGALFTHHALTGASLHCVHANLTKAEFTKYQDEFLISIYRGLGVNG